MVETSTKGKHDFVNLVLRRPAIVTFILFAVFLFQIIYLAPWLLDTKRSFLNHLVNGVVNEWSQGVDVNGFALSPESRVAYIPATADWNIDLNTSDEMVGLTPILSDASPVSSGWGSHENSTEKHRLLALVASQTPLQQRTNPPIYLQYVYLGERYLGYAQSVERSTIALASAVGDSTEKAWFVAEHPIQPSLRVSLIVNLLLLGVSLAFAISAFVMSKARSEQSQGRAIQH